MEVVLTYLYVMVIIGISALIQGTVGFGFSLVAVPLLAFAMPLKEIVPMLVLYSLFLNIMVWFKVNGKVDKKKIMLLIIFGLISIPLGIYILNYVKEIYIQIFVGILIIISSLAMIKNYKITFKNDTMAYGLAGILSGILNGATSLSGPPVILMLSNEGVNKGSFRKTLATYFMVLNIFSLPMFIASGLLDRPLLIKSAIIFPSMVIGVILGIGLGNRMKENHFRKITLGLVFAMGLMTVISSV
jgi:uncharacterized membrane protein YfcA